MGEALFNRLKNQHKLRKVLALTVLTSWLEDIVNKQVN